MSERIVVVLLAAALAVGPGCASSPTLATASSGTSIAATTATTTTTTTTALPPPTRAEGTTDLTPPPARPELTTTADPEAAYQAFQRRERVLRTVFEPYGRWAFSGIRRPVVGDCFLGESCDYDLDDLFTPEVRQVLTDRAATGGVDPVSCTTGPVLLAEDRFNVLRGFAVFGSWNGEGVEEPVRIALDPSTLRISDVICSVLDPVGAGGALTPPPVAPAGSRHSTAAALALVWDLFVLDEETNLTRCVGGDPSCDVDLDDWFTDACQRDLRRRYDEYRGMASVIGGGQNITRIVGRSNLRFDGHVLSLDAETWWGYAIPVSVDLDRLLITSLGPQVPTAR